MFSENHALARIHTNRPEHEKDEILQLVRDYLSGSHEHIKHTKHTQIYAKKKIAVSKRISWNVSSGRNIISSPRQVVC